LFEKGKDDIENVWATQVGKQLHIEKKISFRSYIDDLFDYLHWGQVFSKVNVRNEYHHICANVSNIYKVIFKYFFRH